MKLTVIFEYEMRKVAYDLAKLVNSDDIYDDPQEWEYVSVRVPRIEELGLEELDRDLYVYFFYEHHAEMSYDRGKFTKKYAYWEVDNFYLGVPVLEDEQNEYRIFEKSYGHYNYFVLVKYPLSAERACEFVKQCHKLAQELAQQREQRRAQLQAQSPKLQQAAQQA